MLVLVFFFLFFGIFICPCPHPWPLRFHPRSRPPDIYPMFLAPWFHSYKELPNSPLRDELQGMSLTSLPSLRSETHVVKQTHTHTHTHTHTRTHTHTHTSPLARMGHSPGGPGARGSFRNLRARLGQEDFGVQRVRCRRCVNTLAMCDGWSPCFLPC